MRFCPYYISQELRLNILSVISCIYFRGSIYGLISVPEGSHVVIYGWMNLFGSISLNKALVVTTAVLSNKIDRYKVTPNDTTTQ